MAIDTAAKRLSSLDFEEVWTEAAPIPDAVISQGDRQHCVWSYSGILAGTAASFVYGPVRLEQAAVHVPGAVQKAAFVPGGVQGVSYVPGAQDGESN